MSDDNLFMISDIDDSENEEISGEFKQTTINTPDQASNSDNYLDCTNQTVENTGDKMRNLIQNLIPNENEEETDEEDLGDADEKNEEETDSEEISNDIKYDSDKEEDKADDKDHDDANNEKEVISNIDEEHESDTNNDDENTSDNKEEESNIEKVNNDNNDNREEISNNDEEQESNMDNDDDNISDNKVDADRNNTNSDKIDSDDEIHSIGEKLEKEDESNFNADDEKYEKYNSNEEIVNSDVSDNSDENNDIYSQSTDNYDVKKNTDIKNNEEEDNDNEEKEDESKNEKEDEIKNENEESNDFADESNCEDEGDNNDNENTEIESADYIEKEHENDMDNKNADSLEREPENDQKISDNNDDAKQPIVQPIVEPPAPPKSEHRRPHRHHHRSHNKNKDTNQPNENDHNQDEDKDTEKEINKPQESDQITPKTKSTKTKIKAKTEDENEEEPASHTIDEIAEISINNGDYSLLNQSNMEKVMSRIRKMQRDALEEGDYELAQKTQIASQAAMRYYNERQLLKHNTDRACDINIKLQATRDDIDFLKEHWMQVLENAKQKANDDLLQLKNEQDEELKKFDENYKMIMLDPAKNLPFEYKRLSPTLLELKRKQSIFINTNNFKSAKALKKEIEVLEEKERKENILRFQKKLIAERNLLIKRQDNKFEVRKDNWVRTIEGIKSVANYEIEHARKCERQLENKYNETNEFSNTLIKQHQEATSTHQKRKGQRSEISQTSARENDKANTTTRQRNATKTDAQEFRQRAMINRIIYTNRVVPKVKKPVTKQRTKKQISRTPR